MKVKKSLEKAAEEGFALTFDDVRLRTNHAELMPHEISLKSNFSKNVGLKIPIVSAAMDTVTEHKLAIELAKLGGLGIIHRNLTIDEQAHEVARVKYHLHGLIDKPICVYQDETIDSILFMREQKGYTFHSFPVLNRKEKLVGILTGNDFEFCDNKNLKAEDIMTTELLTVEPGITIEDAYKIMKKEKKKALPIINKSKEVEGLYIFSDVQRIITRSAETYNLDKNGRLRVGAAVGVGEEEINRVERLFKKDVDVIVIDTAHADSRRAIETLKKIKNKYKTLDVVIGNISIGSSAERLAVAGADGIKVGQGPGSICTTRVIAGIGRPQVSAVYDCTKISDKYGIPICADGGLRNSGDITIAIAAGASSVMLGGMLAGTEEAPGITIFVDGNQWKSYRGMGSIAAMESNKGSRDRYAQGKNGLIAEGIEGLVSYKGRLKDVIFQYIGGLRNGMGYAGADSIDKLREYGDFDRITHAGFVESHPHDIKITKEAPNYRPK